MLPSPPPIPSSPLMIMEGLLKLPENKECADCKTNCRDHNTEIIRNVIRTRYMYLPYFYTLFWEANTTGIPVMRPLWMEFPADGATFGNDEAFMVGSSLLVQGIYTARAKHVSVYLAGQESWFDLRSGTAYKGGVTHKLEVL